MLRKISYATAILSVLSLMGCGGADPEGLYAANPTPTPLPTLADIQETIFTPICADCHTQDTAPQGLNLSSLTLSYDNLVNVEAGQQPGNPDSPILRVDPGNADGSYLVQKIIEGGAIQDSRMPEGRTPLTDEQITMIRSWIDQGAPRNNDATSVVSTKVQVMPEQIEYAIKLSGDIAPASISPGSALIYFVSGDERILGRTEFTALTVEGRNLLVSYTAPPPIAYERIELQLNNPAHSALLDTQGRYVDINGDGEPGGMLLHVYP